MKLKVGSKKLQDILVDDKLPRRERDNLMVAALGNSVLWVVSPEGNYRRWSSLAPLKENKVLLLTFCEK